MKHSLKNLPFLNTQKVRKVFKNACERFDLVYFGTVSQHRDEHVMVRGFTLSPTHLDNHYCVGTVSGRDVILLERTDTISFPDKPSRSFSWTIIQIDLRRETFPHIFLNATPYDPLIYAQLAAKFQQFTPVDWSIFGSYDQQFMTRFRVYGLSQQIDEVHRTIDPGTASVLGHHFAQFDYELMYDRLIVYAHTKQPTDAQIEHMFKAGIWLASQLDPLPAIRSSETQTDGSTPLVS